MIRKYIYGQPFETEALTTELPAAEGKPAYGQISTEDGFSFRYTMGKNDAVYGLGENVRGINKRGYEYISNATDDPNHYEDKKSLYAAHNFIIISGRQTFGLFVDFPGSLTFDIGYHRQDQLVISCDRADLYLYVIEGESLYHITRQFRKIIGRSYIPPKFAFGFGQSRWGVTKDDFRKVADQYRSNQVPIDMIYMDIDYMQSFKDFTLNEKNFTDFPAFVQELKDKNIRLIPIIDAGVKIEKGYHVYDEGVEKGYFCKKADGSEFIAAVWPGYTHLPDFLNKEARKWFGDQYRFLLDQGIEGFWNDMNEPAIFYTPEGIERVSGVMKEFMANPTEKPVFLVQEELGKVSNNAEDYASIYHNVDGKMICHKDVHNLYGYNMTRAAGEAFDRISPDKRILMFSRSSYVGMHRYGGIWQGDNLSWWSHLLMNLKMMPSLNMVGFLYTGADIGGFGSDTTRDLLLRWEALGVFTPLMRNHSALGTREQEFYQFEDVEDFRSIHEARYRMIPYLYSEFVKAALNDDMMFKPLAFEYPDDQIARETEDPMMVGNEIMIAPVYTQNASVRYVYLPEDMKLVKFCGDGSLFEEEMTAGIHYIQVALDQVPLFIRKGKAIPIARAAQCVADIDYSAMTMHGYAGASYLLYNDDGYSKDYENPSNYMELMA